MIRPLLRRLAADVRPHGWLVGLVLAGLICAGAQLLGGAL